MNWLPLMSALIMGLDRLILSAILKLSVPMVT